MFLQLYLLFTCFGSIYPPFFTVFNAEGIGARYCLFLLMLCLFRGLQSVEVEVSSNLVSLSCGVISNPGICMFERLNEID